MSFFLPSSISRIGLIVSLLFATIGCDQATKLLARDLLSTSGGIAFIGGAVQLEHAQNPGAFLSLGAGMDEYLRFWLFTIITGVFLGAMAWVLATRPKLNPLTTIGLTLILGGGLGNLIDRMLFGSVTDFLILEIKPFRTGIFNVADMAIVAGTVLLLLKKPRKYNQTPEQT